MVGTTSLGHRELQHPLRAIEYGGRVLRKHLVSEPAALLFGSEKFGLSNDDLSYCQWLVRIGTEGSMNLGQAVAVCLYELTRKAVVSKPEKRKPARAEDLERLTERLTEVLWRFPATFIPPEPKPRSAAWSAGWIFPRTMPKCGWECCGRSNGSWGSEANDILGEAMTKIQLGYDLVRPLTDADASKVADVHSQYGIFQVHMAPAMDKLAVEYDASRLSEKDVEAVLQRFGLPIQRKWVVP